jgi:hypothetical protein
VELVLATVVLSVILLGMHSAMMLAWRATPQRESLNSATMTAAAGVDLLASELAYATSITSASATSIEFVVPDRTGDGAADSVSYVWSGNKGDPLVRRINGSAAAPVAADVAEFQLVYRKRSSLLPTTHTESGEVMLSYYDGLNLLYLNNFAVDSSHFVGQHFKPSLPNGATEWRVTRVQLRARSRGAVNGSARVQVRTAVGVLPGAVLDEATLDESTLSTAYAWREFAFRSVQYRPAGTGLCLVVQWVSDAHACEIEYQGLLAAAANSDLIQTGNGGGSWTAPAAQDLRYYVLGTYRTPNPAAYGYWLTGVGCTLRCGSDPHARAHTTIRVLNEPQVSGP